LEDCIHALGLGRAAGCGALCWKHLAKMQIKPNAHAIMDKGYDSDAIRNCVQEQGGTATLAVKADRTSKPTFDQHIYTH